MTRPPLAPGPPRPAARPRHRRRQPPGPRRGNRPASPALRTPYWLGDSAVRLHALASLIAQAQQLLPQAVHDARDQELTWAQIGELLDTTASHRRTPLPRTSHDPLDKDHRHILPPTGSSWIAVVRSRPSPVSASRAGTVPLAVGLDQSHSAG